MNASILNTGFNFYADNKGGFLGSVAGEVTSWVFTVCLIFVTVKWLLTVSTKENEYADVIGGLIVAIVLSIGMGYFSIRLFIELLEGLVTDHFSFPILGLSLFLSAISVGPPALWSFHLWRKLKILRAQRSKPD